jgi:emp24/gp25L/p24 family/GOLD
VLHCFHKDISRDKTDKAYAPTYITATERPADRISEALEERTQKHGRRYPKRRALDPTNKELDAISGSFTHNVMEDGEVSICVRASAAGSNKPMLFGIRVEEANEIDEQKKDPGLGVDDHLSFMEKEMNRIEAAMHNILSQANFAKDRDSIFHSHSNDMHAASLFWPIVQVCVLLMTGFTQVSHMVKFFKSRRII